MPLNIRSLHPVHARLRRIDSWLRNLPIARKMLVIACVFCLYVIVCGAFILGSIGSMRHAVGEAQTLAITAEGISEAASTVSNEQSAVKDYVIDPRPELAEEVERIHAQATGALDRAMAAGETNPELRRYVETSAESLQAVRDVFTEIRTTQTVISSDIEPRLYRLGPQIADGLVQLSQRGARSGAASSSLPRAVRSFADARIDVTRFRSTKNPADAERALEKLESAEQNLRRVFNAPAAPGSANPGTSVLSNLQIYQDLTRQLAVQYRVRGEKIDRLIGEIGPAYSELSAATQQEIGARLDTSVVSAYEQLTTTLWLILALMAFVVVLTGLCLLAVNRLIAVPIEMLANKVLEVANGEQQVDFNTDRNDEIGKMSRAMVVFRENAREMERQQHLTRRAEEREKELEALREKERIADRARAEKEKRQTLADLASAFETRVHSVTAAISNAARQIEADADQVARSTSKSASVTADVASAAQQSSQNAVAIASASEEMAQSIAEVSAQVLESSSKSKDAAERARKTDVIVTGLAEDASQIGEVVDLINSIAAQTNLLALNATIEAARAGDAGRGFAVVAGEIKALAAQTSGATTQIGVRVSGIQSITSDAVAAIDEIVAAIGDIDSIATSVAAAVEQQSATTSEIARNTQQAAAGSEDVARNVEQVRSNIADAGVTAGKSLEAAAELRLQVEKLQEEADQFLKRVRAA